ncbi:hypothetical protein AQUCO_00901003v1 [Aquilegia coerulea]|uniref:Fibronectin type III-like domain-containing protein n=1 Tax=Aquilegia coerulea TaxID=218851 RepID=A0A2G5EGF0_AQUCA|nr:hypothetical protein AQUCO_00901003v1 [Aquilegia coerulea]
MFIQLRLLLSFGIFIILITFSQAIKTYPHTQYPCKPPDHHSYAFCNTSLPISTRAQSLISLLTLPEKITQLCDNASSIARLGIPAYEWWSESLHGIATNGPGVSFNGTIPSATSFPQVLVTTASFNKSLWFFIGAATAVEARAMYNVGQAGLTFWAPNINIFRDPRWGRGQETPGEDPMTAAAYAVEYIRGFQGENWNGGGGDNRDRFGKKRVLAGSGDSAGSELMLSACCKHLIAYDLENWKSFTRYNFNAVVSNQDMQDTFMPPFRSCVEDAKASCLMCSYNEINGVPACANKDLLQQARLEWGFKGYIASDCDAVATVYEYQHYAHSAADAVADVLKAGTDINCGTYMLLNTQSAIEQGKVQEEDIDRALYNLFSVQLRLGLFNGNPAKGKYGKLGPHNVCTKEHRELALEAAKQGIILLKNDRNFLPLKKTSVASLAVIGPTANGTSNLGGTYTGIPCDAKSFLDGFQAHTQIVYYTAGCIDVACQSTDGFAEAVRIARMADVVVVVAGLDLSQETEDRDRVSLLLPGKQMDLIAAVAVASKRPMVLVLTGGGPIDVSFAKEDARIASILWVGYPGEAGGLALAEIIFGKYNPGGRLPMTWYPESFTSVPMNDMRMRSDLSHGYPGRTYRFYTGETVYEFGYGLSYSNYNYKLISAPNKISLLGSSIETDFSSIVYHSKEEIDYIHIDQVPSCDALKFYSHISVMNNGNMSGSHVVMLFSRQPRMFKDAPQKQLIGFNRVHTESSGATETSFLIEPCKHLSTVDKHGIRILNLGNHILMMEGFEHSISIDIQ